MSRTKKTEAADLRAEMARKGITRKEVADQLGVSYSYVRKILAGIRDAEARRVQIAEYIESKSQSNPRWMRGVA
jgi:transcriptional regulator with XRE-family HTH domain